jgi:hypothetical protein
MKILSHRIVTLTPELVYSRIFRDRPDTPRTPGIHAQEVNRYLAIAAGKLKEDPDMFPRFSPTFYPLLPAMGIAWEDMWASLYDESKLIWQPGEWERDEIYGTPDGLMIDRYPTAIAECKLTYKKIKPVTDDWLYMRQGMSYCAMGGLSQVEYHVNWALGDYKRPYQPIYDVTLVEFNEAEIETWWSRCLAVKDKVKPE